MVEIQEINPGISDSVDRCQNLIDDLHRNTKPLILYDTDIINLVRVTYTQDKSVKRP